MTKETWYKKYTCQELCKNHHKYFEEWWDPDLFDWEDSWALAEYCSEYFDIWWDPEKFDWSGSDTMHKYMNFFDSLWNTGNFNHKSNLEKLIEHCSSKFTELQLKQLLLHSNKKAREFATEELERRENDKR